MIGEREQLVATLRAAGCVFAEDEADELLAHAADATDLAAMVARRASGVPIEHIVGWAEFCGLRVAVDPGVFVPRPRTRTLARQAAALARPGAYVVDLCCGSGAIGMVVASEVDGVRLVASDIDPVAVRCARRNLAPFGAEVLLGDLFESLPHRLIGAVDVLVANVPYVPSAAVAYLPAEARLFESHLALDGGDDGLDVLRRIAASAPAWLANGGRMLVESSAEQAGDASLVMARNGLSARVVVDDEFEVAVVIGHRVA